jgi:transcriptional regulator with XRE-family HTH domain
VADSCRRPIEPWETPNLRAAGQRLAALRREYGLTQTQLAQRAERIEAGARRTRRSTLERIGEALANPSVAAEIAKLAGPSLAPESEFAERVGRRRARRSRKRANAQEAARSAEVRELLDSLASLAWRR